MEELVTYVEGNARKMYYRVQLKGLKMGVSNNCKACRVILSVVAPYQLPDEIEVTVHIICPVGGLCRIARRLSIMVEFLSHPSADTYHKLELFRANSEFSILNAFINCSLLRTNQFRRVLDINCPSIMSTWSNVVKRAHIPQKILLPKVRIIWSTSGSPIVSSITQTAASDGILGCQGELFKYLAIRCI